MHRAKLLSALAALALVVGLAGCGGSSDDAQKSTTTEASGKKTTTSEDDGDTSTTEGGDDGDASTTVVATGGGEFCDDLAKYINEASMTDVDVTDPDAYKEMIEDSTDKSRDLLSSAPDEVQDSVEILVDVQEKLAEELEKVDYDFTKLPADAMGSMATPEFEKANDELTAYVEDTCGIDIPDAPSVEAPDMTTATVAPPSN